MGRNFIFILILVYLVVGLFSFVYILKHNFSVQSKFKALENKILETNLQLKEQELNYLKKQIHPHFLFNTLNTIYGFALKKSEYTPDIILKLSNLLDYILYQVQKPTVLLEDEIEHIKEYIDLEKIRFQDRLNVSFSISKKIQNIEIPPMLLIPFVENAFKHGSIVNGKLNIEIETQIKNNTFSFFIRNTFIKNQENNTNGIGLENIVKRLELLYSDNYSLDIKTEKNNYSVTLKIINVKKKHEFNL